MDYSALFTSITDAITGIDTQIMTIGGIAVGIAVTFIVIRLIKKAAHLAS